MLVCYVDEAGDTATIPSSTSPIQPLFCILGLAIDSRQLGTVTRRFVELKREFFPHKMEKATSLDGILVELKGADLRADMRSGDPRVRRHHLFFIDHCLALLESVDARLFGRIWIKAFGVPNDDSKLYTSSIQHICNTFEMLLKVTNTTGFVIADSRSQGQNRIASFSIFTRKFQRAGDDLPSLVEMPTFGHSENHAGLQIVDLLVSAILFPLAAYVYGNGYVSNVHVNPIFEVLRKRYGSRLQTREYRYQTQANPPTWDGGLVVSDPLGKKGSHYLFHA